MSDLFIFDMGEVLLFDVQTLPQMAEEYSIEYDNLRSDYALFDIPLMEGFMSVDDYYRHLEIKYDIPRIEDNPFYKYFKPHINSFMIDKIKLLKARGNRVVVGSNTFAPHWEYVYRYFPEMIGLFDSLYASHLINIAKPFTAFWNYIMKTEGYSEKNTIFIDDRVENIESAKSLGITTFQYLKNDNDMGAFFSRWI